RIIVSDSLAQGGVDAAREILEKAFGSRKASQVLERVQGQLQNTMVSIACATPTPSR
ncbi:MAG: hypothetical protein HC767_11560, partial [Akkermansiaceae bacterium]|nr:hypothetical protein [Akkermansiaceae bacterium]